MIVGYNDMYPDPENEPHETRKCENCGETYDPDNSLSSEFDRFCHLLCEGDFYEKNKEE